MYSFGFDANLAISLVFPEPVLGGITAIPLLLRSFLAKSDSIAVVSALLFVTVDVFMFNTSYYI